MKNKTYGIWQKPRYPWRENAITEGWFSDSGKFFSASKKQAEQVAMGLRLKHPDVAFLVRLKV